VYKIEIPKKYKKISYHIMSKTTMKHSISIIAVVNSLFTELLTSLDEGHKIRISKITEALQAEGFQTKIKDAVTEAVMKIREAKATAKTDKKPKDPDAPKRPASAYILFCKDARKEIKEANPKMKNTEIVKEMAAQWNNLSDKKKKKYTKVADIEKAKYAELKEAYLKEHPEAVKPKKAKADGKERKPRRKREKDEPKPAKKAKSFFNKDNRAEVKQELAGDDGKADSKEVTKRLAKLWKDMNVKDREPYTEKAKEDKERFTTEMKEYEAKKADASSDAEPEPEVVEEKPKKAKKAKKAEPEPEVVTETETESEEEVEKPKTKKSKKSRKIELSFD